MVQGIITLGAAVSLVVLAAGCAERIASPSGSPRPVTVHEVVAGTLEPGETHLFLLRGEQGEALRVRLRVTPASGEDILHLRVRDVTNGATLAAVNHGAGFDATEDYSEWFEYAGDDPFLVRVSGRYPEHGGAYVFELVRMLREGVYGDTFAGTVHGGVEHFSVDGVAGDEVIVFLQLLRYRDVTAAGVTLTVSHGGTSQATVTANQILPALEHFSTGRFRLPATGRYDMQVSGNGDFRFMVKPIDRRPSTHTAQITIGSVVAGEAIDHVGDVDEFQFHGAQGEELVGSIHRLVGLTGGLTFEVASPAGTVVAGVPHPLQPQADTMYTQRFTLPATGEYTARVYGAAAGSPTVAAGSYEFLLRAVDRRPASVPEQVTLGEWVLGEAIDYPGDVDEYTLDIDEPGLISVAFRLAEPALPGSLELRLFAPAGGSLAWLETMRFTQLPGATHHTGVLNVGAGVHRIVVDGVYNSYGHPRAGGYELRAHRIRPEPESVAPSVQVGVLLHGEATDEPFDIDTFAIDGSAGQEFILFLAQPGGVAVWESCATITPAYPSGRYCFGPAGEALAGAAYGVFTMPTGPSTLTVFGGPATGPYEVLMLPLDRRPETRAAAIALGELVTGESIQPRGDIDEFVIHLEAGSRVRLEARYLAAVDDDDRLRISLVGPDGNETAALTFGAEAASWLAHVYETGEYIVRVMEFGIAPAAKRLQGEYEFTIHLETGG